MEKQKKRRGDRKDGRLLRELDSLHFITGIIYPNRCDNEAYISLRVDLTAMNEYLAKRNETETEFPYTMFHIVVAALLKTITLRPYFDEQGRASMRETLDLGLTIDERLADGYYYSKSVRLLQYLLEHPWELEKPMKEEVQYE